MRNNSRGQEGDCRPQSVGVLLHHRSPRASARAPGHQQTTDRESGSERFAGRACCEEWVRRRFGRVVTIVHGDTWECSLGLPRADRQSYPEDGQCGNGGARARTFAGTFAEAEADLIRSIRHGTVGGTLAELTGTRLDGAEESLSATKRALRPSLRMPTSTAGRWRENCTTTGGAGRSGPSAPCNAGSRRRTARRASSPRSPSGSPEAPGRRSPSAR